MITDINGPSPPINDGLSSGGQDQQGSSSAPVPAAYLSSSSSLAPLPRCTNHPRRDVDLFCKACSIPVCATCTETEHRECQQRWDRDHGSETPRNM